MFASAIVDGYTEEMIQIMQTGFPQKVHETELYQIGLYDKFDTKNRILYLPIWQNMTGIIYDLLVGHEVGHALYTPAEGWHDAVSDNDKNKNYKNFLNVVTT